jgi:endonuclease/exonuclease/phosphatase family metal-dependent hydrolase
MANCPVCVEAMESRILLSSVIRVATYNIEDDINGATAPLPGLYQVLEGIGEENVQGNVRPLDILGLEETTSNSASVAPVVAALNSYYNGSAVYAASPYQATQSGTNADGNGPNALVYNTLTLNLLASVGVGTPAGSANGEYRQAVRYEFQPVGDSGSTGIFYVYESHMKSGSTSTDAVDRGEEATIIRDDEANLPADASVIYMGDLNAAPPEAQFTTFTSPTATNSSGQTVTQGEGYDAANFSTSIQYESESATELRYRDDYQLVTSNVLNGTGAIDLVNGSYHVFGNNGTTPAGGSVDSGSDMALNSDLVQDGGTFLPASTLYSDLTTASDHLPVVADYTLAESTVTTPPSAPPATAIDGSVLTWNTHGQKKFGTQNLPATAVATGAAGSTGLTRGSGVLTSGTAVQNGWGGKGWASTAAAGIAAGQDITWGLTVSSGYSTSLSSINLDYRRNKPGPIDGYWQYQVDGGAWGLIGDFTNEFSSSKLSGAAIAPIALSGISALQNLPAGSVVNFRLVPYGAARSTGNWFIYAASKTTNDLVVAAS